MAQNQALIKKPELLMSDAFVAGWMLIVRLSLDDWRSGLVTGVEVGPAIERWIESESYKERTS